jgi:uncharacterized protein
VTTMAAPPGSPAFPFGLDGRGRVRRSTGAELVRERILQVLFTAPGERVHQHDFGCGLLTMVFEPADPVVAAALEFTVGQSLLRWLGDEIFLDGIDVDVRGDSLTVEVAWRQRADGSRHAVRALVGGDGG